MKGNPLREAAEFGQSIWLDYLSRRILTSGELVSLIQEDGLKGVTSNPTIFEKAIGQSDDYDAAIAELASHDMSPAEIYEALVVDDIRLTADLLRPVYDRLDGRDGFVSLEVSPHLAHDTAGTVLEARRLWARVARPNLFIKVPGTWEGVAAFRQLIAEGININVTLLFGIPRYRAIAEAYLDGLSDRVPRGLPLERVSSVASFFLSRIDVLVDPLLDQIKAQGGTRGEMAASLRGQVAIACAKVAYKQYRDLVAGPRYQALVPRGAQPQRVLWASTGTKDKSYSDVKYVDALIGPETVNTMPLETINAFRDHGDPVPRLEAGVQAAMGVLGRLAELGVDLQAVTRQLEDEGVEKFIKPYDKLLDTIGKKIAR
jgi:transaldolase